MILFAPVTLSTQRLIAAWCALALILLVAGSAAPAAATATSAVRIDRSAGTLVAFDTPPESAQQVTIGIYAINVYDVDIRSNTFRISAYIWLRWNGDFDPVATLELPNAVESWGLTKTPLQETPKQLADGSQYQALHIEGRFFQYFDLRKYPLDRQELTLFVESSTEPFNRVVYLPDATATGYDSNIRIPGWQVTGLNARAYIHDYGTNFGELGAVGASQYSTIKFSFDLARNVNLFEWKLLLPLLIVMLTNWFALFLKPTHIEVRTVMPATALLTAVLMRQSAMDAIPECPTLVLMDQIYVLAYLFIVLTLLQIIWANIKLDNNSADSIARIMTIDKRSFVAQIIGFATLLGLLLLWS